MRFWTQDEKDYLTEITPGRSHKEITALMNERFDPFTVKQIAAAIKRYGLNTGRTGRFPKGHEPVNKGKKKYWVGGEETQFKKGHMPVNHKPVGSERIDAKDGYLLVKVEEPNVWKLKHRVIWEEANGPIPGGQCLIFLDGDKTNISLDNLMLVTRAQNVRMNQKGLMSGDPEITKTGAVVADLINKTGDAKRRRKEKR